MKITMSMTDVKKEVFKKTGIILDFRTYGYAPNHHNLSPQVDYSDLRYIVSTINDMFDATGCLSFDLDMQMQELENCNLKMHIDDLLFKCEIYQLNPKMG